jgi:hypothetical protein
MTLLDSGSDIRGREKATPAVLSVPRADPDLLAGISPQRRGEVQRLGVARVWRATGLALDSEPMRVGETGYGLLVLSGVLCRRLAHDGRTAAELVGPGDLIRPLEPFAGWSSLAVASRWAVIKPAHLAVLDRAFAERVAPFPEVAIGLNRRSVTRVARVATMLTALCHPRVEDRLTALFSHLADRFGKTRPGCIYVPLPLTHGLLAELVAARRPSVTKALAGLREEGALVREEGGWLLRGPAFLSGPPPTAGIGSAGRRGGS